ncbi:hypothetical protein B0H17DRAFT_1145595 [Mycena rosella]|uniref:Uncharacterized protein n=1 Tax=Mycena rosella TaxID=1033263 RepID=A0AAD7CQP7_MYCRO|nr:hypothetical protein B0H17DRAFT_1145595 [Mycena rosella]
MDTFNEIYTQLDSVPGLCDTIGTEKGMQFIRLAARLKDAIITARPSWAGSTVPRQCSLAGMCCVGNTSLAMRFITLTPCGLLSVAMLPQAPGHSSLTTSGLSLSEFDAQGAKLTRFWWNLQEKKLHERNFGISGHFSA